MTQHRILLGAIATLLIGLVAPGIAAAAFDPIWEITPSTRQIGANPDVHFKFVQDAGEEPIGKATIFLPKRFRLPPDAAVSDGDILGHGQLKTATAPSRSGELQATFDARLYERDRTAAEQQLWAVWVADLGPADVEFLWTRFPSGRLRAIAEIPGNPFACPPVTLTSTINATSASGTKMIQNPRKVGIYTIKSVLLSRAGSQYIDKEVYRFSRNP